MDLLPELLFTALLTAVFSLLVAKLLSVSTAATDDAREFSGVESHISELTAQRSERRELRVRLAEVGIGKVDKSSGERSVDESPEEDFVGGIDCDENAVAGVSEGKVVEHLMVDDEIVGDARGDDDGFENSGDTGENVEKIGGETDIRMALGSSDPVIADDVDEENTATGVSEQKIVEHPTVDDEIVRDVGSDDDSFENSGAVGENVETIGVEGVIKVTIGSSESDRVIGGRKLDGFDDVDEEDTLAWVSEEKIVEHLMVDDEIVEDVAGDNDSLANSGAIISEKVEKIRGEVDIKETLGCSDPVRVDDVEKIVEHLAVRDKINEDVGGDYGRFENSGAIGEVVEKPGVEGAMVLLWSSNPVVDDDVAFEEMSEKNKMDEYDDVDGENAVAGVSEAMVVEHIEVDSDSLQNLGANDEKVESIGVETDIMVNSGRNEPLVNEAAVEEKSEGRVFEEKIVEHAGVDNDNSEISGANVGKIENMKVVGDIMVNLAGCDDVVVNQGFHSNIIENAEEKWLIGDENNEKAKVNDEIVTNIGSGDETMKSFTDEDDDWEGIERSELEKDFAAAANYVFHRDKDVCKPKLDNDVKMELYGLNKVALEGPCREPQPMAIKVSARAKWNAWQRLGNMSPEVAMEQYISLLSDKAPEWMERKSSGDGCKDYYRVSEASRPDIGTYPENQLNLINESVLELNSTADEGDLTGGSISVNKI